MGNWVLNIVGSVEKEVEDVVANVVKASQDAGHTLKSVRLTTDEGEKILHIGDLVGTAVEDVIPAAAPAVAEAEKVATTAVDDAEKVSADLNPEPTNETVQTPPVVDVPQTATGPAPDIAGTGPAAPAPTADEIAAARKLVAEADAANPPQAV